MAKVTFDENKCKGCGLCANVCPKKIVAISKDRINVKGYHVAEVINQGECIACAFCATMCPDTVIKVEK